MVVIGVWSDKSSMIELKWFMETQFFTNSIHRVEVCFPIYSRCPCSLRSFEVFFLFVNADVLTYDSYVHVHELMHPCVRNSKDKIPSHLTDIFNGVSAHGPFSK